MADFPRQRRHRAGVRVVGEARQEPGKRKVRHDRWRWPTRRLSGSLTPLENTLLTTRRYVLHTSPRAILRLGDALVYFAHRRHRRSSSSSSVSSSSTRGNRGGPSARSPHSERVRYLDASSSSRTLRIIRKATSPTSEQIGKDGSLVTSRFYIAAEERLRSPSRAVIIFEGDLALKTIRIEFSSEREREREILPSK